MSVKATERERQKLEVLAWKRFVEDQAQTSGELVCSMVEFATEVSEPYWRALEHQVLRSHPYSPDGCSACESAKKLLEER